ncbi:respiratory burst oxidase homolog protein A-like [Syzygium oleosum]|uniref:respiratory burst oxidase homolog protein A-like n=1 Tax=Syzygium oleosum TaxID=219896 RepID=UPI0024BA6EA8|nr:respiratory burst oxidase homolog protein A-like [Syzygium oleosum]
MDSPEAHYSLASVVPVQYSPVPAGSLNPASRDHPVDDWDNGGTAASPVIQRLRFLDASARRWKQVEERFDRITLNRPRDGIEPAAKWSDFGFCLGIQRSTEYAHELLRALRGRDGLKANITRSELHYYWRRITDPCPDSKIQIFFDLCDRNMDGVISRCDIKQVILLSASANKLCLTGEEADEYAALIMDAVDSGNRGRFIEISQVETLLKFGLSKDSFATALSPRLCHRGGCDSNGAVRQPMSRPEVLFRTYWRRAWIVALWLAICMALFTWKFIQYRHRMAFEVMGYCLCTAKGAAETLKFNMAVILLPVCRNTVTWLRASHRVSSIVPFNDNINFHKLIAAGIVIGVILHGGTHLACDFPRISSSDHSIFRQTIAARFGYHQPSYIQILATTEGATGIAMVVLMAIAFSLATRWPRRQAPPLPRSVRQVTGYNAFWYSHHLFIFVYALLIVHSMFLFLTSNLIEKTTWMYIAFPVLLYMGERIFRAVRSAFYEVEILKANVYPGKVLSLTFRKPEGFEYRSGMYIYIQCPRISPFEWHPFSLTSGPDDAHLSVHVRTLGDWSYQLYSLFQEAIAARLDSYPKIYIDGPYGAACQDYAKYDVVVLIGIGIGATPFISILKDVIGCDHVDSGIVSIPKGPSKAYLYWVTRDQSSFTWFRDFIKQIPKTNRKESIMEMHNFLTSMYKEEDARSVLLSAIQALSHAKSGVDFISQTPVHTHFARPNWSSIFSKLSRRHGGSQIGVFYCGPSGLARELEELCTKFSTKTITRFVFHKEHY